MKEIQKGVCVHCENDMYKYKAKYREQEYTVYLCWLDGYFEILPEVLNEFTLAIMDNPMIILEMLHLKKMVPV